MDKNNNTPNDPCSKEKLINPTKLVSGSAGISFLGLSKGCDIPSPEDKMIGIQIGPVSFVDEGVEEVLEILQEKGGINTLFISTFSFDRGISGRQIPGHPFPDHGVQESDQDYFHGGNFATPNPEFYKNTKLKGELMKAPDFGDLDIIEEVLPAAKERGMKVFCSVLDGFNYPDGVPGMSEFYEENLKGEKSGAMCFFKPDVKEFWVSVATDLCTSYDIDGILLFNERNGPLLNALGASHQASILADRVSCFCPDHEREANNRGLDFERVIEGYKLLNQFVHDSLDDKRPTDGYFVEFQRILLQYPEISAFNLLFDEGKHQVLKAVRDRVKGIHSKLQVGFHIEHVNSFNPYFRASRSYSELGEMADFLKVVVYNNAGGERYARFVENIGSTLFRDVPLDKLMRFNSHLLNYSEEEADLEELPKAGLSPDYVYRETKRALAGVNGKSKILPGIDIGIPTGKASRKASPEDTFEASSNALKAGADGLILSRKYSEMMLENLEAAGNAVKSNYRS
jgi:hypothetical protein